MRLALSFAAAAALLLSVAAPAAAQTAPAATATQAQPGLTIQQVTTWLTDNGAEVLETRREGDEAWLAVHDGQFTWLIFFYSCNGDFCGDIQYAASFDNPAITPELINQWNRDRRFLKAYYEPGANGEPPSGVVQYDVLLSVGDVTQMADPTVVWLDLLEAFAIHVGNLAAPSAAQ